MSEILEPGGIARRLLLRRVLGTGIMVVALWSCPHHGSAGPTILYFKGRGPGASDKSSDNGPRQQPTQRDVSRQRFPSGLR